MNSDINITKFKLYNVQICSPQIDLSVEAWVEIDESSSHEAPESFFLAHDMLQNPQWGFTRWYKDLCASNIVIGTIHSSEQAEVNPFECTDCSYIAIALAILADYGFIAGIEYSMRAGSLQSIAPYTSTFNGDWNRKVIIMDSDIPNLRMIYEFVYHAFRTSTNDERKIKLISLFCQCIVRTSPQSITALKWSFNTPFSGHTGTIIYASMFFEHVFTITGWMGDVEKGIKYYWNIKFPNALVKWEDIKVLQKFRSTLVHDNPVKAQQYISEWKQKHNIGDDAQQLAQTLEKNAIQIVKQIMRSIVLNYGEYLEFRDSLAKDRQ